MRRAGHGDGDAARKRDLNGLCCGGGDGRPGLVVGAVEEDFRGGRGWRSGGVKGGRDDASGRITDPGCLRPVREGGAGGPVGGVVGDGGVGQFCGVASGVVYQFAGRESVGDLIDPLTGLVTVLEVRRSALS